MPHVEQDLFIFPEHLRSPPFFGWLRVAQSLFFYVLSSVLIFVSLSFSFSAMALSVYFQSEFDCPSGIFRPSFKIHWQRHGKHEYYQKINSRTQNTRQNTNDQATEIIMKTSYDLKCSRKVGKSCSSWTTSGVYISTVTKVNTRLVVMLSTVIH